MPRTGKGVRHVAIGGKRCDNACPNRYTFDCQSLFFDSRFRGVLFFHHHRRRRTFSPRVLVNFTSESSKLGECYGCDCWGWVRRRKLKANSHKHVFYQMLNQSVILSRVKKMKKETPKAHGHGSNETPVCPGNTVGKREVERCSLRGKSAAR